MKFRRHTGYDEFDGLTAEDVRKIRAAAAVSVTPGLEGLAQVTKGTEQVDHGRGRQTVRGPIRSTDVLPVRKRGRRA